MIFTDEEKKKLKESGEQLVKIVEDFLKDKKFTPDMELVALSSLYAGFLDIWSNENGPLPNWFVKDKSTDSYVR